MMPSQHIFLVDASNKTCLRDLEIIESIETKFTFTLQNMIVVKLHLFFFADFLKYFAVIGT